MAAFTFKLELADGTPADPPTLKTAVPDWRPGDTIPLSAGRTLQVVRVRVDAVELVIEDMSERASGAAA